VKIIAVHGNPNSTSASFSGYVGLVAPKIVDVEKVEGSWRVNDACSAPVWKFVDPLSEWVDGTRLNAV
jgi:hypothetical protein